MNATGQGQNDATPRVNSWAIGVAVNNVQPQRETSRPLALRPLLSITYTAP